MSLDKLQGESSISFVSGHITCGLWALLDASFQSTGVQSTVHIPNTTKTADAHSDGSQK